MVMVVTVPTELQATALQMYLPGGVVPPNMQNQQHLSSPKHFRSILCEVCVVFVRLNIVVMLGSVATLLLPITSTFQIHLPRVIQTT